jgi:hypothetical protein
MFSLKHCTFVFLLSICVLLFCVNNGVNAQAPLWGGYRADIPLPAGLSGTEVLADGAKKFFLLKTGMLVEATVENGENSVKLKTQYGTMQVPKENIEFTGKTREEIYRYKKSLTAPNSCTQGVNFAEWCLNNGFYSEAVAEFQTALLSAPNDNLKNYIQQRLEQVQHNTAANGVAATDTGATDDGSIVDDKTDSFDRWANGVPKSVFDTFSKKVQPILAQRCAAAACHGSNSPQKFRINIPRQPGGKTTRSNLRATVQYIDPDNPGASPILSAMVTQHCGKRALFSVESEQYNNVIDWFQLTARELPPEHLNVQSGLKNEATALKAGGVNSPLETASDTVKLDTAKLDMLPKQFQESLEAMTKGTVLPPVNTVPINTLSVNTIPEKTQPKIASNHFDTVYENRQSDSRRSEDGLQEGTDPFDPFRFNVKHHRKIIEAKLKKQVSDTVIR